MDIFQMQIGKGASGEMSKATGGLYNTETHCKTESGDTRRHLTIRQNISRGFLVLFGRVYGGME